MRLIDADAFKEYVGDSQQQSFAQTAEQKWRGNKKCNG